MTTNTGWKYFKTSYFLPLQTQYSSSAHKINFHNEAAKYIDCPFTEIPASKSSIFEDFYKKLAQFCKELFEGRNDEIANHPYVIRTSSKITVTACTCARIARTVIDELIHNTYYSSDSD